MKLDPAILAQRAGFALGEMESDWRFQSFSRHDQPPTSRWTITFASVNREWKVEIHYVNKPGADQFAELFFTRSTAVDDTAEALPDALRDKAVHFARVFGQFMKLALETWSSLPKTLLKKTVH